MNRILFGAAAIVIAVPAMAQVLAPAAPIAPIAPRMEMTHTRDQVVAKVRDHFAKMDVNRDGFIGGDELTVNRKHPGGAWQGESGRTAMMRERPMHDPNAAFDRLDANHDGAISRGEFAKGRQMRIERKMVMNGAPGAAGDHRGMRMKMHRMGGGRMMKMADLNRDGRVSLQEATTSALQHFDQVDTNRDGRITPDERRSMRQRRMEQRGRAG